MRGQYCDVMSVCPGTAIGTDTPGDISPDKDTVLEYWKLLFWWSLTSRSSIGIVLMSVHLVRLTWTTRRWSGSITNTQIVTWRSTHAVTAHGPTHTWTLSLLQTSSRWWAHTGRQTTVGKIGHWRHSSENYNGTFWASELHFNGHYHKLTRKYQQ